VGCEVGCGIYRRIYEQLRGQSRIWWEVEHGLAFLFDVLGNLQCLVRGTRIGNCSAISGFRYWTANMHALRDSESHGIFGFCSKGH